MSTRRPHFRPATATLLAAALFAMLGCAEDTTSPPDPSAPAPAISATTTIAIDQLSVGQQHTCARTTDNRLYCWGWNLFAQLGDGTIEERTRPVPVATTLRFRQLTAGFTHSCAVTTDFRAYCWGENTVGGLGNGDGSGQQQKTPVAVAGGLHFRQVDAGDFATCGISYPDNHAYCWGANFNGQLGTGTSNIDAFTPQPVLGGLLFQQVSVGETHACGVTLSHEAWCWGGNRSGQLGINSADVLRNRPARVVSAHGWHQIDAGWRHTCAVTVGDRAYCWGEGLLGQIGDGQTRMRLVPKIVAGDLLFHRVTAGATLSCGESSNGGTYCWGRNVDGELGDGTRTRRLVPTLVVGGFKFKQVNTSTQTTCGKTSAGVAYCWGPNGEGQVGDGTAGNSRTRPTRVLPPS
jgi:alpha-tubulin suppressor-like RCC1 family protein